MNPLIIWGAAATASHASVAGIAHWAGGRQRKFDVFPKDLRNDIALLLKRIEKGKLPSEEEMEGVEALLTLKSKSASLAEDFMEVAKPEIAKLLIAGGGKKLKAGDGVVSATAISKMKSILKKMDKKEEEDRILPKWM